MLYFSGVKRGCDSGYSENEADVPYSVVDDCLEGGSVCICTAVSSANKKEGHNPDTFSPDEQLEYIVCGYKDNYSNEEN